MQRVRFLWFMLIFLLILSFLAPIQVFGAEDTASSSIPVQRISGKDRIETSIAVAQQGWDIAETVILNEYDNYADALAATPFATQLNAPVLLTRGGDLDPRIRLELERLEAKKVILLGGEGRLSTRIEDQLTEFNYAWERIGGLTRYDTSVLIAQKVDSDSVILVNGDNYPDALSAASYAGIKNIPIILIPNRSLPETVINYYQAHTPAEVMVVGGSSVVPDALLETHGIPVDHRFGGLDRYDTAAQLYAYAKGAFSSNDVYFASGEQYPDAMVGTILAAKNSSALLITKSNALPSPIAQLFDPATSALQGVFILGGTGVISPSVYAVLSSLITPPLPKSPQEPTPQVPTPQEPIPEEEEPKLAGKTIVVDPGHGFPNPGALGPSGTQEMNNNLAIAKFLALELENAGANVILTRTNDNSPAYDANTTYTQTADLQSRVAIAEKNSADLFVSLHNDSWQTAHGTTTFYASGNPQAASSIKLAQSIQKALTQVVGTDDLGVKDSQFYVLRRTTMPAVLVEVAFISHPTEEMLLADDEFRKKAAHGVARGIFQYFGFD
ncbi:N-acetylmuramoyl-L-alanine amidase [Desulfitobacterium dichloroeliminans LMG P-21439]|uniref:N-acetylmuramoyl-L-alanine amidase n=1 Tax=Desulfitobacterium dichloroeliminans (strain LMG P-21439 / DCA1) TaxID=871963 RepID=L0F5L9_DESDL|nr:cell wall-binding repeat-containing protein [Desulfitobacterium dichloroeliminans]AGA68340.1 N-acetylmuramoyl-L-alanine amidase [Desulfitobacterium dichloroeliminans LMG P-21439]